MTRPIISGEQFQNPPTSQPPAPPVQAQAQAPLAPAQPRDTLAGAFPAWDLVPTVHFIRRVK